MTRPLAALLLIFCTLFWGLAFTAQKSAMLTMGPLTFAGVRYVLGALLVAPLAILELRREARDRDLALHTKVKWIVLLCLSFFLGVWLQQAAMKTASVTSAGFLTSLYVIFTPILVFIVARLRPHPIIYLTAPMVLGGVWLLTGADLQQFQQGEYLLIGCALCWAAQVALLGKLVAETRLPVFLSCLSFIATAVLSLVGAALLEEPSFAGIAASWSEILYTGVLSTAIAFTLQAVGQQYVPPSNAAIILSLESVVAAIGGAVLLNERLPFSNYIGAGIIFAAVILTELVPQLQKAHRRNHATDVAA